MTKQETKPAHNSAQAQPEKGMRLCAKRYGQVEKRYFKQIAMPQ